MTNFFYNLILEPIITIYEIVYGITRQIIFETPLFEEVLILSILVVSIVFNMLTYPLYKKAAIIQNETRIKKEKMSKWVEHIKKNFKGDERYFILSAYYKENNYNPIDQLKESLSLLIQIPFFAAAYIFFTSINFRDSKALKIISLAAEDGLLYMGGININVLPILMTIINLISASIYTKGFKLKDKLGSFILPILFLIILYHSPSALVLYWTFNNIFSLIRNIILKNKKTDMSKQNEINSSENELNVNKKNNNINVIWIATSIFLFLGIVIPTLVIKASPGDFDTEYYSLYSLIYYSINVYLGFALWTLVYYCFADDKRKFVFTLTVINVYMLINHMLYINNVGFITEMFHFAMPVSFPILDIILDIIYIAVIFVVLKIIYKKFDIVSLLARAMCISLALWSVINIVQVKQNFKVIVKEDEKEITKEEAEEYKKQIGDSFNLMTGEKSYVDIILAETDNVVKEDGSKPVFNVSKNGKNVIFICLDRFIARYYPYVIAVKPEIKEKLDGFKIWTNTFSFGDHTLTGTPGMYGGYEYSPYESNKRDELLVVKHNEALTLMPKKFVDEGYNTIVSELPYENYHDVRRESVWASIPEVKSIYLTRGIKSDLINNTIEDTYKKLKHNVVYYSIVKTVPLLLKITIYDMGSYLYISNKDGYSLSFLKSFSVLNKLGDLTNVVDDSSNNAFIMHSILTHEPNDLSYPDFYPNSDVHDDNHYAKDLYNESGEKFEGDIKHLDTSIAALIQLGNYFDYLRENDVYDNTRIIIVADHGGEYGIDWDRICSVGDFYPQQSNPILMYKDFFAKGYEESDEFMTNADAPYLALNGISKDMKNPWTGKEISMDYKNTHDKLYTITWVDLWQSHIDMKKYHSENGKWGILNGHKFFSEGAWSVDTEIEKNSCIQGYEHNIVYREVTKKEKCGKNYTRNMYECTICGKCFDDEGAMEIIKNPEQYIYEIPHKFTNYISDNNDSIDKHGTKTARCDYGCGKTNTIYDTSANIHHHFVNTVKRARLNEDGYIGKVCDICGVFDINDNGEIIPALKELKLENENVEKKGNKTDAVIIGIDKNDNQISSDNIETKFFSNDNIGSAYAMVTLKNHYENKNEFDEDEPIKIDYKIVPERVKIKKIEYKRGNLVVSIDIGKDRINDVEIIVDDKEDKPFIFRKTEENEYKVNLAEFNNEAKTIKVRVVKYDNVTGERLCSHWTEREVD